MRSIRRTMDAKPAVGIILALTAPFLGGCLIPVPFAARCRDLPGWGRTYEFRNPDGTAVEKALLVVDHDEWQPWLFWLPFPEPNELHVYAINNGQEELLPKRRIKFAWIWAYTGGVVPITTTRFSVIADGMDCYHSGPGWYEHGGSCGRIDGAGPPDPTGASTEDRKVCTLVSLADPPSEDHQRHIHRLATWDYSGYRRHGLAGEKFDYIREFARKELARIEAARAAFHPATRP